MNLTTKHLRETLCAWCMVMLCYNLMAQERFSVSGTIINAEDGAAVAFTQVAMFQNSHSKAIAGTTSDDRGHFVLSIPEGTYKLKASFVGYAEKVIDNIEVHKTVSLGTIKMTPETKQLEEVVVKAEEIQSPFSSTLEGLSINPEKNLSNIGGSVIDILRNTPSVNVDQDGNVSIRGSSNTNVLIDGRNSVLSGDLEQLPASMIDKIDIITNPNAKYDAQGEGGVINIQLKQGAGTGTSGKAELTIGNRERLSTSLRLNKSGKHVNVFGGYSFRQWKRHDHSTTDRETYDNNQLLKQKGTNRRNDWEHTFNTGIDYAWHDNKLSYEGTFNMEDEEDREMNQSRTFDLTSNDPLSQYVRINTEMEDNHAIDNTLIFTKKFKNSTQDLKVYVSHSYRDQHETQYIDIFSGIYVPDSENLTGNEQATTQEYHSNYIGQLDYVHPIGDDKLETGYKLTYRDLDNDYVYEEKDMSTGELIKNEEVSNRFIYQDQINAAYAIYSRQLEKFGFSAGVRMENTTINTHLVTTKDKNKQQYTDWFPSVQLLYHTNTNNTFKITYSRRIDRPRSRWLNPFRDISDSLNIRQGNPDLQPEYIQSFELGHLFEKSNWQLTSNLFYRYIDGWVDYIVKVEDGISYRGPTNLNNSYTLGFEIINVMTLTDWWKLNASYSLFHAVVDGQNLDDDYTNEGMSWNAKLTSDITLPFAINWQLNGFYEAPEIEAQGRDLARYYLDMSFSKKILQDKGTINLTCRDIFNTFSFAGENSGDTFRQTFEYNRDTRMILLSMSYQL